MKLILSSLLMIALLLGLCACGSGSVEAQPLQDLATLPRGTAPKFDTPTPTTVPAQMSTDAPTEAPTVVPTDAPIDPTEGAARDYVLNTNSMKFHVPGCGSVDKIKAHNRKDYHGTREEIIKMGYDPCKNCNP